ncbi:MAG: energy transducer TonB [Gammaproteobacteria bacterium]
MAIHTLVLLFGAGHWAASEPGVGPLTVKVMEIATATPDSDTVTPARESEDKVATSVPGELAKTAAQPASAEMPEAINPEAVASVPSAQATARKSDSAIARAIATPIEKPRSVSSLPKKKSKPQEHKPAMETRRITESTPEPKPKLELAEAQTPPVSLPRPASPRVQERHTPQTTRGAVSLRPEAQSDRVPPPQTAVETGAGEPSMDDVLAARESTGALATPEVTAVPLYSLIPKPLYPRRSRHRAEQGTVMVAILVGEDGSVRQAQVTESSGYRLLDGSALSTVKSKWHFKPAVQGGKPVASGVTVPIEFKIR